MNDLGVKEPYPCCEPCPSGGLHYPTVYLNREQAVMFGLHEMRTDVDYEATVTIRVHRRETTESSGEKPSVCGSVEIRAISDLQGPPLEEGSIGDAVMKAIKQ